MVPPGKEGMFSRASWDTCSYNERLALSSGTLGYTLSPLPMSNPGPTTSEAMPARPSWSPTLTP